MPTAIRPLVAGNWKMNGLQASLAEIALIRAALAAGQAAGCDVAILPPATLVAAAAGQGGRLIIGAQDCHANASGAHTGDLSAAMLKDAGAQMIITGHSERRADHGETDAIVRAKAAAVLAAGLTAIICVGETRGEREAGKALDVVGRQLQGSVPEGGSAANRVIAYEPVWAIGTGLTPTPADIQDMHAFIRSKLPGLRLLYGGSVKPSNAAELMGIANVNGALVGGASLKCADFMGIAGVYR